MNKINKKHIKKALHFNYVAFPFFSIITIVLVLLEAVTYPGFVRNRLLLGPEILFGLLVVSAYLVVAGQPNFEKTSHLDILAKLTTLLLPASIVVGFIFLSLENNNYRGYVYTHGFHFDPVYFFYLYAISALIILVSLSKYIVIFSKSEQIETRSAFVSILSIGVVFYYIFLNLGEDILSAKPKLGAIIKHPTANRLWKGRFLFADFYDYMLFINKYTPDDAVIMRMTQQGKWPSISNDGYVRGFIYPRYTKEGDDKSLSDKNITHVFIHRAYEPPRVNRYIEKWPTFPVKAKRLIYMKDNNVEKEPIIIEKDYDPNDHQYDGLWGIIELER